MINKSQSYCSVCTLRLTNSPTLIFLLVLMFNLIECESKKQHKFRKPSANQKVITLYLGVGLSVVVCCFVCTYICTKLLPNGPNFGAIELDDIRIERLDDIESGLKSNIEVLKDRLAFHRKKKTYVQTERDIKKKLGERAERFNDRGRSKFGEAWDTGNVPQRDLVEMTSEELVTLKKEVKAIKKERKEEEKRDMWALWDDLKGSSGGAVERGSTGLRHSDDEKEDDERSGYNERSSLIGRDRSTNSNSSLAPYRVLTKDERFADNRTSARSNNSSSSHSNQQQQQQPYDKHQELAPLTRNTNNSGSPQLRSPPRAAADHSYGKLNVNANQEDDDQSQYNLNLKLLNPYGASSSENQSAKAARRLSIDRGMQRPQKPPVQVLQRPGAVTRNKEDDQLEALQQKYAPTSAFHDTVTSTQIKRQESGNYNTLPPAGGEKDTTNNGNAHRQQPLPPVRGHLPRPNAPAYHSSGVEQNTGNLSNRSAGNTTVQSAIGSSSNLPRRPPPPIGPPPGYVKNARMHVAKTQ